MTDQQDPVEPQPRRKREKALHRREIIDAAIAVFAEKGFYTATLDEIAQKAEFSKGALYLYFQNKEDILFSILKQSLEEENTAIHEIITNSRDFQEELRALFHHTAGELFQKPGLFTLLTSHHVALFRAISEENRQELFALQNIYWNHLRERACEAIAAHEIRDFAPEAIVGMVRGAITSMIMSRWSSTTAEELEKGVDIFMDMIFNGISFRKG